MSAASSRSVYCKLLGMFSINDANESYLSPLWTYVTSEHCMQRIQSRLVCCLSKMTYCDDFFLMFVSSEEIQLNSPSKDTVKLNSPPVPV